jgi:hypothetical protein
MVAQAIGLPSTFFGFRVLGFYDPSHLLRRRLRLLNFRSRGRLLLLLWLHQSWVRRFPPVLLCLPLPLFPAVGFQEGVPVLAPPPQLRQVGRPGC